jgi:hypothetical protein
VKGKRIGSPIEKPGPDATLSEKRKYARSCVKPENLYFSKNPQAAREAALSRKTFSGGRKKLLDS